ncbi:MAG: hypothetical protein AAF696_32680 [Bacteroidota bacterium]
MSLSLLIYTADTNESLVEKIEKRFLDYKMKVKFHPGFTFDKETNTGFCPFRLEVLKDELGHYEHFQKPLMTGFEIYFKDYAYEAPLKPIKEAKSPKKSFLKNLFGGKTKPQIQSKPAYLVSKEIDEHLEACDEQIMISWQTGPELRVSLFFASFLAELTQGVVLDPRSDEYFLPERSLEVFPQEIVAYEQSFSRNDFTAKMQEFDTWL